MRIATLSRGRLAVESLAPEELAADRVRIEIAYAGICGSDLQDIAHREGDDAAYGGLGHEYSGVVSEVGAAVTRVRVGDPVVCFPRWSCLRCEECRAGRLTYCRQPSMPDRGAWADQIVVPERVVMRVPNGLSLRQAVLVEPLACALRGVNRANAAPGHAALVIGGGPMGALTAVLALHSGARRVIVSEPRSGRRELVAALGATVVDPSDCDLVEFVEAETEGRGVDVAYEVVGAAATVLAAIEVLAPEGTAVILGVAPPQATAPISPLDVFLRELAITGAFGPEKAFADALEWLPALRLEPLLTHELPLEEIVLAVEIARAGDGGKVLLNPKSVFP